MKTFGLILVIFVLAAVVGGTVASVVKARTIRASGLVDIHIWACEITVSNPTPGTLAFSGGSCRWSNHERTALQYDVSATINPKSTASFAAEIDPANSQSAELEAITLITTEGELRCKIVFH